MPVRFLSDAEFARLSRWPDEIAEHDLITFFTLTSGDAAWLSGTIRVENRIGATVQLCTLPWLGWIPDDLTGCPSAAASRLGGQLGLAPDMPHPGHQRRVLWTTTYMGDALDALRADGYPVTNEAAGQLTPAQHDHINFYGTYEFDVETELRRKGALPI